MFQEDRNVAGASGGPRTRKGEAISDQGSHLLSLWGGGCSSLFSFVLLILQRYSHPKLSEFSGSLNHNSNFPGERIWLSVGRYPFLVQSAVAEVGGDGSVLPGAVPEGRGSSRRKEIIVSWTDVPDVSTIALHILCVTYASFFFSQYL